MKVIGKVTCAIFLGLIVGVPMASVTSDHAATGDPDTARLDDNGSGVDWAGYGRTFGEQHFSPLAEVNAKNVARLSLTWWIDLGPGNSVKAPIEVGGTLYYVTGLSTVHAADAKTGRVLWTYDPKIYQFAAQKMRLYGSRGVAYWHGKIYLGSQDGRLIALDALTGVPIWIVMTVDPHDVRLITGAPRVFDGKVIIGHGGADMGPIRGYVTTYDAETGKLLWRWYTVPGNPADGFENKAMEMAAKTWFGEWWTYGGGGTVWNAISYDPDTNTVFIGVGNGSPHNHKARSAGKGDNLFLCSVVALDANTGTYKWHYQINPGDSWDYDAVMDMEFADLHIGGQHRKVLLAAPKNGFFYVIDRLTGKLISAEPYVKVNWASKIDLKTGRPVEDPAARYPNGSTFIIWPSEIGGHNWFPMAFSPKTDLAYIPAIEKAQSWTDYGLENGEWRKESPINTVQAAAIENPFVKTGDPRDGTSKLVAWNVRTQKLAWLHRTPGPFSGGVMATGGNLVFQGQLDGRFNAYAADTGKLLWSFEAKAPILAPPISYSIDGRQYITVMTGNGSTAAGVMAGTFLTALNVDYWTQAPRVLTFALDGGAKLPPPKPSILKAIADPGYVPDDARAAHGAIVYAVRCIACHGMAAVSGGATPDLRASAVPLSAEAFRHVVKEGARMAAGMPPFAELSDSDLDDIRQYVRSRAQAWRNAPNESH